MNAPANQLELLPVASWTEDAYVVSPRTGKRLERWGSVKQACKILAYKDRESLYPLIRAGLVRARKNNPLAANSPWKVDLVSVWEHKVRQEQAAMSSFL